ncbi:MAG: hypothetical protein H6705_21330 [Myxococcales bacterium]|nr:hypothetical protein [Myxococcales bacterium]
MATRPDLAHASLDQLDLSPETRAALRDIKAELDAAYREQITEMASALNRQAKALDRIQTTLHLIVRHLEPTLAAAIPPVLRVAESDEAPDLASAVVIADPVAAGFTLSQANVADALGLSAPDVSVLIRHFKLHQDPAFAVTVRRGRDKSIVNYRPAVIEAFRERVQATSPATVPENLKSRLTRVAARLA